MAKRSSLPKEIIEILTSSLTQKLAGVIVVIFLISFLISVFSTILNLEIVLEERGFPQVFQQVKSRVILETGIIIIFGILLAFLLVESIIAPLRIIIKKAKKIAQGELPESIKVDSDDELGDLATILNKMTEKFRDTIKREKAISQMKSEFLSIAAHQLRTPLSGMKWVFATLIEEELGSLNQKQKECVQNGYDANERMIRLVDDLLQVGQIEEGRFEYTFRQISLAEVIRNAVHTMAIMAIQKNIKLRFHLPPPHIPEILLELDGEKFQLAVSNILDNAIQYTPEGGLINVSIIYTPPIVRVNIQDTGIGIAKHQISLLFTKFFRAARAIQMQPRGSGLGLFIAKNIVEKHGGKIVVESEEGRGSTFSIILSVPEKLLPSQEQYRAFIKEL